MIICTINTVQFTQFYFLNWSKCSINSKARIERLSECGVDSVNEGHCVRDAVEGQSSCTVIHIHSYSRGAGDYREFSVFVIVPQWADGVKAVQIQGMIITTKLTLLSLSLLADVFI